MKGNRLAVVLLPLVVVIWGVNWPTLKIAVEHSPPVWFAVLRLVLGWGSFALVLGWQGRLKPPPRSDLPVVLSIGLLQMAAFMALINLALLWVPAGRSAILAYTTPLWVAPGAALFLGERLTPGRLFGVLLGLAGVAVLFNPLGFDWTDRRALVGNGLLLSAALVWAVAILHVRGHRWTASPLELAPWQMLVGLAPLAPLAWVLEGPPRADWTSEFLWVTVYNGPLATAFAFWAAITVNRLLPAVTVSLAFLCVPVAGLVVSSLWLDEPMTATNLIGLGLIVAGVAAVAVTSER